MANSIYSLIDAKLLQDVLKTLQVFGEIPIQLLNSDGARLLSLGNAPQYCCLVQKKVFTSGECSALHRKAGQRAQQLGEAYIFSCHANLNYIAFSLCSREDLLGSVIVGPFLMDDPDSTLISGIAERYRLTPSVSLELYDELFEIKVISTERAGQLQKLVEYLLSPLVPNEQNILAQKQEKAYQQAQINETIQIYKEQKMKPSLQFFNEKEKELLNKVRIGSAQEVKGLLNELLGYVLFSQGGKIETMRVRAFELTTLLSRVALDGGANANSVYELNGKFLALIYQEQDLDDLCMLLQDVAEGFMSAIFYEKDKGNTHIRKALRYIADHYYEHLELAAVAEFVQLSPSYFSTLFRQVVGMNFRELLCHVRVEESKRLLVSTDYSLGDIAVSVGFPDQSYYCKIFKKIVGVSPGKYRSHPVETVQK